MINSGEWITINTEYHSFMNYLKKRGYEKVIKLSWADRFYKRGVAMRSFIELAELENISVIELNNQIHTQGR